MSADAEFVRINGTLYRVIEWDFKGTEDGTAEFALYAEPVLGEEK